MMRPEGTGIQHHCLLAIRLPSHDYPLHVRASRYGFNHLVGSTVLLRHRHCHLIRSLGEDVLVQRKVHRCCSLSRKSKSSQPSTSRHQASDPSRPHRKQRRRLRNPTSRKACGAAQMLGQIALTGYQARASSSNFRLEDCPQISRGPLILTLVTNSRLYRWLSRPQEVSVKIEVTATHQDPQARQTKRTTTGPSCVSRHPDYIVLVSSSRLSVKAHRPLRRHQKAGCNLRQNAQRAYQHRHCGLASMLFGTSRRSMNGMINTRRAKNGNLPKSMVLLAGIGRPRLQPLPGNHRVRRSEARPTSKREKTGRRASARLRNHSLRKSTEL